MVMESIVLAVYMLCFACAILLDLLVLHLGIGNCRVLKENVLEIPFATKMFILFFYRKCSAR